MDEVKSNVEDEVKSNVEEVKSNVEDEENDKIRVLSIDIGIKNLSFCVMEFDIEKHEFDLLYLEKTSIGEVKQTCVTLSSALIDFLNSSKSINEKPFNYIFIENQLSRAIKNTVLGYAAFSYFYTLTKVKENGTNVQFISPRNKFKAIDSFFPGLLDRYEIDHSKALSRDLKKLSVQIAKDIFEEFNVTKGLEAMRNFKKKDDISDVTLQSFSLFLDQAKNSGNPIGKRKRRS